MAEVYQQYLGRLAISSASDNFTVGANALTLTSGYYFTKGYTGESASQLVEHVQAKIRTVAAYPTANVACSGNTGLVTISLDSNAVIAWTDSPLAALLGFPSTTTGSLALHTGSFKPRCVWRPSDPAMSYSGSITDPWMPATTTRVRRAPDGTIHTAAGSTLYETMIRYQALPEADILANATPNYRSLKEFYEDVISAGRKVRIYMDRTKDTSSDYTEAAWGEEEIRPFAEVVGRIYEPYQGYWRVTLPWWKWI